MSLVASIVFLTPAGALIAFAVAIPLAAAVFAASRRARARRLLALGSPTGRNTLELASLAAVPLLLALAAANPAIRSPVGHGIRKNTEAIFVVDVSRSMAAAAGPGAPTRLAQAKAAAMQLRDAIPDVPVGISSLTTELVPHLFPSTDETAFATTLENALGVLKPRPPAFQIVATTFDPLGSLATQGFFGPAARRRVAVLLTDGESTTFYPDAVGQRLGQQQSGFPGGGGGAFGGPRRRRADPVKLLIVRFGGSGDRIYRPGGGTDPGYRPDIRAGSIVSDLARATGGRSFDARQLASARAALRSAVGSGGPASSEKLDTKTTRLAPYIALLALVPLGFLLWRRNLTSL